MEVHCWRCFEDALDGNWYVEEDGNEESGDEFFIICECCDREVEFGWSHPDRAGASGRRKIPISTRGSLGSSRATARRGGQEDDSAPASLTDVSDICLAHHSIAPNA